MGLQIESDQINMTKSLEVKNEKGEIIGELRSACYSPHFKKVIGIAMINKPYWDAKHQFKIDFDEFDFASCDYYKKNGTMLPNDWKEKIKNHDLSPGKEKKNIICLPE